MLLLKRRKKADPIVFLANKEPVGATTDEVVAATGLSAYEVGWKFFALMRSGQCRSEWVPPALKSYRLQELRYHFINRDNASIIGSTPGRLEDTGSNPVRCLLLKRKS
jgi:hypothetical protein